MKIGIFGGSFNPPHNMHKRIATYLIDNGYVDKIIFVPTGDKYPKDGLVKGLDRYLMVKKMILDDDRLEVSDYEIKNKLVYTYQTLDYFKSKYPVDRIYFICGMDNFKQLNNWKNPDYILDNYEIIAIDRGNYDVMKILDNYSARDNIIVAKIGKDSLSSTEVRANIRCGRVRKLVRQLDSGVLEYIKKNNLYKEE